MQDGAASDLGLSMNIRRRPERGSVWRIAPPLTVAREDIDLAMTIFDQALTESRDEMTRGSKAQGQPVPSGQDQPFTKARIKTC